MYITKVLCKSLSLVALLLFRLSLFLVLHNVPSRVTFSVCLCVCVLPFVDECIAHSLSVSFIEKFRFG